MPHNTKAIARHEDEIEIDAENVSRLFLAGRSANTMDAYRRDLEAFARWLGADNIADASRRLLSLSGGKANAVVLAYRAEMIDAGLAPATVNRRLAALRSLVKLARMLGVVGWAIETPRLPSVQYRETRGCGVSGYRKALAVLGQSEKDVRDRALLRLMFDMGLRRGEVISLDLEHYDAKQRRLSIMGKARRERETLSVPVRTAQALGEWVRVRGDHAGPLFVVVSNRARGLRLTGCGVYTIVRDIGKRAGVRLRPHGLRHAGITAALDSGEDIRAVQRFSRHRNLNTLIVYDDNRQDLGGAVAEKVAGLA